MIGFNFLVSAFNFVLCMLMLNLKLDPVSGITLVTAFCFLCAIINGAAFIGEHGQ